MQDELCNYQISVWILWWALDPHHSGNLQYLNSQSWPSSWSHPPLFCYYISSSLVVAIISCMTIVIAVVTESIHVQLLSRHAISAFLRSGGFNLFFAGLLGPVCRLYQRVWKICSLHDINFWFLFLFHKGVNFSNWR